MNEGTTAPKLPEGTFDQWALVELMGHNQIVGRVTETALAGGAFIRVDVPAINGSQAYTRFFNPSAVYSLNPVTEDVARAMLTQSRFRNEPVSQFDLPRLTEGTGANSGICGGCGKPESNCVCDPRASTEVDYCPDCHELNENCTCP